MIYYSHNYLVYPFNPRYRNMLIARRTRLRFKSQINDLKRKVEELSTIKASLMKEISSTVSSSFSAADLVRNEFDPPSIVVDVMKTIYGSEDFQAGSFLVMSSVPPTCPIVYATDGYVRMTGYSRSELVGKPGLFLCGETDSRPTLESIGLGQDFKATLTNYRKNGEMFQNSIRFINLCDQKGCSFLVVAQCQEVITSKTEYYCIL